MSGGNGSNIDSPCITRYILFEHRHTVRCDAGQLTLEHFLSLCSPVQIASCEVYRLKDDQEPGRFRYLLVEPFLEGKYIKVREWPWFSRWGCV